MSAGPPAAPRTPASIVVLSTKAAGSSALQAALARLPGVRHVAHTRHYESETLWWTKAASLLGHPQQRMLDSEVPIPAARARRDLRALLRDNVPGVDPPEDDEALVFDGWQALVRAHAPVFVEKSPHHLQQPAALALLARASRLQCASASVDPHFVWLLRNPLDTLYSAWTRWRTPPERAQWEWLAAQRAGLRFEALARSEGWPLLRIHYEALVCDTRVLAPLLDPLRERAGGDVRALDGCFHRGSLGRHRDDPHFGFELAAEVRSFARELGYDAGSLRGRRQALWPLRRRALRLAYRGLRPARFAARGSVRWLQARRGRAPRPAADFE